jgi:hypothetical protein
MPAGAPASLHASKSVRITSVTSQIVQGGIARVAARYAPSGGSCVATVVHAGSKPGTLGRRHSSSGLVRWTWRSGPNAAVGRWRVTVNCGRAGRAQAFILVVKKSVPAHVVVVKSGFSQAPLEFSSSTEVDYGLVLQNTSPDETASRVSVTVNLVDSANHVIKTDADTIEAIPPSTTYYHGSVTFTDSATTVSRLETIVQVGARSTVRLALPPVSNVLVSTDPDLNELRVTGEFSNPYTKTLSGLARITAVIFDAGGDVIGGSFTFPQSDVPPGGREGFDMGVGAVAPDRAASAQVSVEPETNP